MMKRAVSFSLGSSTRDKKVVVDFNDEMISIERIGTRRRRRGGKTPVWRTGRQG